MTVTTASPAALDDRLAALFAGEPEALVDPYSLFQDLRAQSPVHIYGDTLAIVSVYPEARAVYRDHERFRGDRQPLRGRYDVACKGRTRKVMILRQRIGGAPGDARHCRRLEGGRR